MEQPLGIFSPTIDTRRRCSSGVGSTAIFFGWLALLWSGGPSASRAQTVDDETTLVQIRQLMRERLEKTPDYSCLQTVDRVVLNANSRGGWESKDALKLETAFVGGKELYSWPGAESFDETPIQELIGSGIISSGEFASHAQGVFLGPATTIEFGGREQVDGWHLVRFAYRVPVSASDYWLETKAGKTRTGFSGSFWADPVSLQTLRLMVTLDNPAPESGIVNASTVITYGEFEIGSAPVFLPATADVRVTLFNGKQAHNQHRFSGCRAFGADSSITFGELAVEAEQTRAHQEVASLPPGLTLSLEVTSRLAWEGSRTGDPIEAVLTGAVQRDGQLIAPKGATVHGRIRHLEALSDPSDSVTLVLEFTQINLGGERAPLFATLNSVRGIPRLEHVDRLVRNSRAPLRVLPALGSGEAMFYTDRQTQPPGMGVVVFFGQRFTAAPGMRMRWKTAQRAEKPEPKEPK